MLKNQVVNDALKELVSQPEYKILIQILQTDGVQSLLENVLSHRLDAQEIFSKSIDGDSIVLEHIESILNSPPISEPIEILRRFTPKELIEDANENLAQQVTELLKIWQQAESALKKGDMISCASHFFTARREKLKKGSGKKTSIARESFSRLQKAYDDLLNPLIGGKDSKDAPPNAKSESLFKELQPLVQNGSGLVYRLYQAELTQRHALDYDDLEFGAVQLLRREDIRTYWQNEVKALLVDEFQDTNARQREIVESLAGSAGRLFVVGDARQSIYRFRRADVTVFRSVQEQAHQNNGLVLNLDITYRAHEPLLNAMGDLLAGVMGVNPDPARPYYVPFTPLIANRKTQPEYIAAPHVEFVFGLGEGASEARPFASRALAKRLLELKAENQIKTWDDIALLFRASTGYVYYEDAFEDAGIPFVTVAGRGFYDRPEIRDVLNLLRALADPADDLAMAGLLRSPAFGLSDSALYQLRLQDENSLPYWTALQRDFSFLTESDQQRAYRTASILRELLPQVDRTPVPDLLSALVDITDYRAILASVDDNASNGRLWRNLDKLISDAQKSGYVNVRDFLEYISILNDAGAREGEAPADAQGAVRLMTIHKSKGLEFPVIVLADAGRTSIARSDAVYLLPETGLSFKLDPTPMLYRLSKDLDKRQNEAETGRLLYVALTRAKDKLIISGHATSSSSIGTAGWMKEICEALKIDVEKLVHEAGTASEVKTSSGHPIRAWCMAADEIQTGKESQIQQVKISESKAQSLYQPLVEPKPTIVAEDEEETKRIWRATSTGKHVPTSVIGLMVHKAIELWRFPDDPRLIPLLESAALNAGLAGEEQRVEAIHSARELLERLKLDVFWETLKSADERYHEIPYSRTASNWAESGYIDLLYRIGNDWHIVDFKTDSIRSDQEREELLSKYSRQLQRYQSAVKSLIGHSAQAHICFLDNNGRVVVLEVE